MVGPLRPNVAGDVALGRNVKIIESYVVLNLEITSSSSFQDIQIKALPTPLEFHLKYITKISK